MNNIIESLKKIRFIRVVGLWCKHKCKHVLSLVLLPKAWVKTYRILYCSKKEKTVVALIEHLGDIVACEPVNRFIKQEHPDGYLVRIVKPQYAEIIQYDPHIDKIVTVSCISEWIYIKFLLHLFNRIRIMDLHINKRYCTTFGLTLRNEQQSSITFENYLNYGGLCKVFSMIAGLPPIDIKPIYYLPQHCNLPPLPEKYIVLHTTANEATRSWDTDKWNVLVKHLIDKGFYVLEVGLSARVQNNSDRFIDLCGKLSFTEIAFAIKKCFLFIGIESGFAHFAYALDVKNLIVLIGDYRNFKGYLVYSGMSEEDANKFVLRHDGDLAQLPVEAVLSKMDAIK